MIKRYIKLSDDFGDDLLGYHDLLESMIDLIPHDDFECYYVSNGEYPGWVSIKDLGRIDYKKKLIVWLCSDNLRGKTEHSYYDGDVKPHGLIDLENICQQHPSRTFVLLTPQCGMEKLSSQQNLLISGIPPFNWMVDRAKSSYRHGYLNKARLRKNWTMFVNYPLWHRMSILAFLLFLRLDDNGILPISPAVRDKVRQHKKMKEFLRYPLAPFEWHCFNQGYHRLQKEDFQSTIIEPYGILTSTENVKNYNEILLPVYETVRVELVPGSIFSEPTPFVTEKELQSIYGSNFMILFNAPGTVDLLRSWGFDMFDDVVDHSYDAEPDPKKRIMTAISNNIELLNGSKDVDLLWNNNKDRFEKNCQLADGILEKLVNDSLDQFRAIIKDCQ